MRPPTTSVFDLPDHLTAKTDPLLIAGDERHFATIAASLEQSIADLSHRLDATRKAPGPPEVVGEPGEGHRHGRQVLRAAAHEADDGGDRLVRHPARADDWAEAFEAPEPGTPHNEAREQIWELLLTILMDECDASASHIPPAQLRKSLRQNEELRTTLDNAWTLIEAADLVADLWSVPAYLRTCAPWLSADEVRKLQRTDAQLWTVSDLPLLDAARQRLGDPEASRRSRRRDAAIAAERERMAGVVDDLVDSDDSELLVMSMLRGDDLQNALIDETALPHADPDLLAGPFAHVVVDEAQELTDAEWQMLLLRCPSRSFTIVGDRAQARRGFTESWRERLERIGLDRIDLASLSINYRTPAEIMVEAEPVIRAALPDANVPTSIRTTDVPVVHGPPQS